tara:strand:- start:2010 stop:2540 length:531 start_codon:yes stop_codon:yes gene_type:complete
MKIYQSNQQLKEKGSVLVISLVLLTAITLISITSLQRTNLQTRIIANVQHSENGFNIANSELDEIYLTYLSNSASTKDLTNALDNFTLDANDKKVFNPQTSSLVSSYKTKIANKPNSIDVTSQITHKGQPTFTSGYSIGGITTYIFEVQADANAPNNGYNLSSQSMGIKVIGPSSI